ncbi:DUF11 domain-containing protein [Deinococcus alpinitundrae]|uniref:DUF11 domain-containing protein n=1 Tax=Deinococcus alpinitundrae TaxID=468913 RepID=UPI001ED9212A|nr:DUF11 domain-containing protein [Deinococcus alpinitundrae]
MRRFIHSLSVLTLLAHLGLAQAAGTPAGTVITNIATGSADPLVTGQPPVTAQSNLVSTSVSPVCAVSVTPDGSVGQPGQQQTILPGESALFAYRVINSGNVTFDVPLSVRIPGESAFTPATALYLDANGNGQLDDGERASISSLKLPVDGSASLLVLAQTNDAQRGDGFVNLVASCAGQPDDANNVALLRLGALPVLSVSKRFSPSVVKPGDQTSVTLTATNAGQGESRELTLSDDLSALTAQGLTYVPGSASASSGTLESGGAPTWQAGDAGAAQNLRVRVPSLKPGAILTLTFKMLAGAATENRTLTNTALAATGNQTAQAQAQLTSQFNPAVALGPIGNPEAPEGSATDQQTKAFALVGQETCFNQTLKNTGDVADSYTLNSTLATPAGSAVFRTMAGAPLDLPIALTPNATLDFKVCLTPQQAGPLTLRLIAIGERGSTNATQDLITTVQAGLPDLIKSVTPSGLVPAGTALTYTLTVRNTYTVALHDVVVRDPLNPALTFTSASDGGQLVGGAVTWTLGSLAPGESRTLSIQAQIGAATADGTNVTNTFNMTSGELPGPLDSNETSSPVWTSKLVIEKSVNQPNVTYGDRLTYTLVIRNLSAKASLIDGIVTDTPAAGLDYLPGSATLAGQPLADPQQQDGHLAWAIGDLPPSANLIITYQVRVTAQATEELLNTVTVSGRANSGQFSQAIASNTATATVKLKLLTFAPLNDIVGTVYIDRNRDGRFESALDQPLARARILLAGGREVLTDAQGRYHFKDVKMGIQALRLDPQSVPSVALSVPMDGGLSGTRTVNVLGLTGVDFPLAPLTGEIDATRSVSLVSGPLTLTKIVSVDAQTYTVTLRLQSAQPLSDFVLNDPLPQGAALKEGRNTLAATLATGETTLTYRFDWTGERRAAVTEPDVRWSY